jgi:hypothetical protein
MHPRQLRCSSLKYSRYSRSSRLAGGAPRPSRCDARLSPQAASGAAAMLKNRPDGTARLRRGRWQGGRVKMRCNIHSSIDARLPAIDSQRAGLYRDCPLAARWPVGICNASAPQVDRIVEAGQRRPATRVHGYRRAPGARRDRHRDGRIGHAAPRAQRRLSWFITPPASSPAQALNRDAHQQSDDPRRFRLVDPSTRLRTVSRASVFRGCC